MSENAVNRKKPRSMPSRSFRATSYRTLGALKLHSKPHCPWCDKPLIFLYGEFPSGTICVKCRNCGKLAIVSFPGFSIEKIVLD